MNQKPIQRTRFAFFGTDNFSIIVLDELKKAGFLPALIVTVPDRERNRGLALTPPLVKLWAEKNSIPLLQPENLGFSLCSQLSAYCLQLFIVASYGLIIPKEILAIPLKGTLNLHPSLLPRYRGATPIESQILAEEKEIGVAIMLMDERVDSGPLVAETNLPPGICRLPQVPKASELKKILAEEGGRLLSEILPNWIAGRIKTQPQDQAKATYTRKFTKTDGEINLLDDPYKNFLKIRAFDDSIGTYFFMEVAGCRGRDADSRGKNKKIRVLIKDAAYENETLLIIRVIPEGRKEMSYEEFLRGIK